MKRIINTTVGFSTGRSKSKGTAIWPLFLSVLFLSACGSGSSSSDANNPSGGPSNNTVADNSTQGGGVSNGGTADAGTGDGGASDAGTSDGGTSDAGSANDGSVATQSSDSVSSNASVAPEVDEVTPEPDNPDIASDQTTFYFSYDESASTASRDLALAALANGRKPNAALGRPYEFLNAEQINAFSAESAGPFNVSMGLLRSENNDIPLDVAPEGSVYGLGVQINGPAQNLEDRRNVVLTVLLDISGSMNAYYADEVGGDITSLLDVAKLGLISMQQSLKQGDVINLVTFASNANVLLEAHSPVPNSLDNLIQGIATAGSTDINTGLTLAYEVANRTYDADKANRVVIVTDAYVNTGVIDADEIARQTIINELEGIHFSGVGVGSNFNDSVLNTMTDVGKGSYSAMITPADASRIFIDGFSRFMSPAARDVRFQLTYPQEMDQLKSFAEEISSVATDVQTINFSYNSSQFFLELFSGPSQLMTDNELRLDITYKDNDGQAQSAFVSKGVGTILGQGADEIKAAAAVTTLAQLINGSLTCDTVLSSQLYNTPVQHDVYISYKQHIGTFCSL